MGIGNSPPAPRFNAIASRTDWTKTARRASIQASPDMSERRHVHLSYWLSFGEYFGRKVQHFASGDQKRGTLFGSLRVDLGQ